MNITAQMVKELRDKTGAGMMDAKKALVETDGDMEKAMEIRLMQQKNWAKSTDRFYLHCMQSVVNVLRMPMPQKK